MKETALHTAFNGFFFLEFSEVIYEATYQLIDRPNTIPFKTKQNNTTQRTEQKPATTTPTITQVTTSSYINPASQYREEQDSRMWNSRDSLAIKQKQSNATTENEHTQLLDPTEAPQPTFGGGGGGVRTSCVPFSCVIFHVRENFLIWIE